MGNGCSRPRVLATAIALSSPQPGLPLAIQAENERNALLQRINERR
jgi:hypothetical protein